MQATGSGQPLSSFSDDFFIDYGLFCSEFMKEGAGYLSDVKWYTAFDYRSIKLGNLSYILEVYNAQKKWFQKYPGISEFKMPEMTILEQYQERKKQLSLTLWVLILPILMMLGFYIFMVSQLIVKFDRNDTAVLKSRGAGNHQIFSIYFIESLLISAGAIIAGPFLGLLICKIVGSSNGFLEFVERNALPVSLDGNAYIYSLAALLVFIAAMLVPAVLSKEMSIVQHKQKKVRKNASVFWKKFCLDFILIAVSFYGFYRYKNQQAILDLTAVKGTDIPVDPLLFLISTSFILGAGLLFLRIYPYSLRFVFRIGINKWRPGTYASFIQVERSGGEEQFLMLFLILTVALGVFNACSARTINKNIEDRARYVNGADVALKEKWMHNKSENYIDVVAPGTLTASEQEDAFRWVEPDYGKYRSIKGIKYSARVFLNDKANAAGSTSKNTTVMGIDPVEFSRVAWRRSSLMQYSFNSYLNLLLKNPKSMLVSRSFQKKYNLKEGDPIDISWDDQSPISGVIAAFIDYWPGINTNPSADNPSPMLVVANLNYIYSAKMVEPYEVWLKKDPNISDHEIDNAFKSKNITFDKISYANQEIVREKNDPMLQGTNGMLTLGFIVTIIISAVGFLIYWILSIKSRVLQFGVFRAMGMTFKELSGIIAVEQLLISAVSVLSGLVIGAMAGTFFIPLLQVVYGSSEQIIPFKITYSAGDFILITVIVTALLLSGLLVLARIVSGIKMDQAVKLGED